MISLGELILYKGLYHIRINESVYLCLARVYRLTIYIIITLMNSIFRLFNYFNVILTQSTLQDCVRVSTIISYLYSPLILHKSGTIRNNICKEQSKDSFYSDFVLESIINMFALFWVCQGGCGVVSDWPR